VTLVASIALCGIVKLRLVWRRRRRRRRRALRQRRWLVMVAVVESAAKRLTALSTTASA